MTNSIIRYTPWEVARRDASHTRQFYLTRKTEAKHSWVQEFSRNSASRSTVYFASEKMAQKKADELNSGDKV